MTVYTQKGHKQFLIFSFALFGLLFIYLLWRAYVLEPIHDEVATFFHYIETGKYWGDEALVDANNHLLNSFLTHPMYRIFGENFFLFRLPNVLSFTLFFWAVFQLTKSLQYIFFRGIVLVALTGIPFVLEYFAYTRGYGISLAFFMAGLVFLSRFAKTFSVQELLLTYFFLIVAVYANLTFLVSCILGILFVLLLQIIHHNNLSKSKQFGYLLLHLGLLFAISPAIGFANLLKESGALYYGSLDGFWEVTGKTLSTYVLFYAENWIKWVFLVMAIIAIVVLLFQLMKQKAAQFFATSESVIAWFLFGHCAVILFMAHVMHVNYPEDRVGMYLVILSLLLLGFLLDKNRISRWGILTFLYFPLVFIPRINLSTSVFSPDDRMAKTFFNEIISKVDKTHGKSTIQVYPLMRLTWALHDRHEVRQHTVSDYCDLKPFNTAADLIVTKKSVKHKTNDLIDYQLFAEDNNSRFLAYERKKPFKKTVIFDTTFHYSESDNEFLGFYTFFIPDSLRNKKIQLHARARISHAAGDEISIVFSSLTKNQETVVYEAWNERWSQGLKTNYELNYNYPIDQFQPNENEVRVYIWNQKKRKVAVKNGIFEIILLDE